MKDSPEYIIRRGSRRSKNSGRPHEVGPGRYFTSSSGVCTLRGETTGLRILQVQSLEVSRPELSQKGVNASQSLVKARGCAVDADVRDRADQYA